jgi:signal transduction histidine kinase
MFGRYRFDLDLGKENILTRLLHDTCPYYSADAKSDANLVLHADDVPGKRVFVQLQNIKSVAGIPLMASGETVGVMFVNYRGRRQFDPDDRQAHELFAQQAAVAIKNAESNELARDSIVREERNHLSRELHHSVSQALFGIKLKVEDAMKRLSPADDAPRADLLSIREIAHDASRETGFIIDELRAPIEESRHLTRGLEEFAQRIHRWYGLDVTVEYDMRQPLPPEAEQKMLRVAREALNNAVRHADCHSISVCCESTERHALVEVRDDGKGFDPACVLPRKLGLRSMRELAESLGGELIVDTAPGAGTHISLRVLHDKEADDP